MKKLVFTLLLLCSFTLQLNATHIVGGDLFYKYLGGIDYQITFIFYRDCSAGTTPGGTNATAPVTAPINFVSVSNSLNFTLNLPQISGSGQEISQICASMGSACGTNNQYYGLQIYIHQLTVSLVPAADWQISFGPYCCRNNPISTISTPGSTSMFVEARLDNLNAPGNSSPVFLNTPIFMFCTNQTTIYNPNAYDPDGDSLSWEFDTPYNTSSSSYVTYLPGYSAQQPFISNPPVSIDSLTGQICVSPTTNVITVTAVKVTQWRKINGIPTNIGSIRRDMQLVSYNCNNNLPKLAGINLSATSYNALDTNYFVNAPAGVPISFNIYAYDPDLQNLTLNADTFILNSTFIINNNNTSNPVGTFTWLPDTADILTNPHILHVIVSDDNCPYFGYQVYTYIIIVIPPVSGMNELTNDLKFEVYPNPASDVINLELASSCELRAASFEIVDMFGKVMHQEKLEAGKLKYEINTSDLPSGVYMLRVLGLNSGIMKKMVVVR